MNQSGLEGFFSMGGYGLYVWGSYGVTLLVMLFDQWQARRAVQDAIGGQS